MLIRPLLIWALPAFFCCQANEPESSPSSPIRIVNVAEPKNAEVPLGRMLDSLSIAGKEVHFLVKKSERIFQVLAKGMVLKEYPCVLGEVPVGDKMMQGDRKTPEGIFRIRSKRVHDRWHAFVWVDYPNAESRQRFASRLEDGSIPTSAKIGGEIGIHGVPDGMDHWINNGSDWTFGCIALRNADLDEIYPYIQAEFTTIKIIP